METFKTWIGNPEFFQFIGALAIMVAAVWYNPKMANKFKNLKDDFRDTLTGIDKKFKDVQIRLGKLDFAIEENTKLTAMTKTRKEAIDLFNLTVSNSLELIGDEKLREFIQIKTKSIIQFTLDLMEMDLNLVTNLQLHTKLTIEKDNIYEIGCEILGQEFIEKFYKSIHGESTNWYERDLLNILHCKINYKQEAIRARTEVFIRESIRAVVYEYDKFTRNK